jgi:hypothetical protein
VHLKIKETKIAKNGKELYKWKEDDINEKFDKFTAIVGNQKFVCKKWGRVANKKNGYTSWLL